jgi:hypothetical protein
MNAAATGKGDIVGRCAGNSRLKPVHQQEWPVVWTGYWCSAFRRSDE